MEAQCSDNSGTPGTPCSTLKVHVVIVGPVWGEPFTERMEISLKHGQRCPGVEWIQMDSVDAVDQSFLGPLFVSFVRSLRLTGACVPNGPKDADSGGFNIFKPVQMAS